MRGLLAAPLMFVRLVYQSVYLAIGQIWANKTRSILTTIGIVIGVASVTAVIAALTGLKAKILSQVETFGSNTIIIQPQLPDKGLKRTLTWWDIRFRIREFEGLLEHCPSLERYTKISEAGQYTIKYGEKSVQNAHIYGVEPAWHSIEHRPIVIGRELSDIDTGKMVCLIEPELRDKLGMDRDCIGETIRIGFRNFRVIGVIEKRNEVQFGGGGQERYEIIIPFDTASKFQREFWIWGLADGKSAEVVDEGVGELKFFFRRERHLNPDEPDTFLVASLKSAIQTFNNISLVVTLVAGGIVGISLLVGGVGIMNIMLVSISERTKEIGLRKAVGAKRSAILTQFLIEAVILCFVGGLVGVGVGKLLTFAIAHLSPLLEKTYIPAWAIVLSFGFAGTVGIVFGMFPAIKAARLDPIEALRHE
ncbi:MAG: ABC transporter permease [Sedimentisphaerales bacterium]|jgi:putative ABC transport system permease protein